jgi:hypothetical protein
MTMRFRDGLLCLMSWSLLAIAVGLFSPFMASATLAVDARPLRRGAGHPRSVACPVMPAPLAELLLRDLPAYQNRVARRTLQSATETYAIVASSADLTPLPVQSSEVPTTSDRNLHQVFFTTLERQYTHNQLQQWQQHHWLFLAQTDRGWQLALLYSQITPYPSDPSQPLLPARESSQSLTAEAIRIWLRDCNAGAIKPS